jgi:hypothetical protein
VNDDVTVQEIQRSSHLPRLLTYETIGKVLNCNGCLGSRSMTLEEQLEDLILKCCQETKPQPQRVAGLNAVFRDIYNDHRFLQYRNAKNPDDYEDALCLMWQHFSRNLCEATTAKKSYYETRSYAVNRLLASLKGNLKNLWAQRRKRESQQEQPFIDSNGNFIDPIDKVPCHEPEPDFDPEMVFNEFLRLLAEDKEGELKAEVNTLHGIKKSKKGTTQETYALTAQTYLLLRYRDDKTIQQIADEQDISRGSLQGGSKPRKWKELARKYAHMAMDLV